MYPHERSLVNKLADKPFALIGVNSDDDLDEIREIVKEKDITWRSFQNEHEDGSISDAWNVSGWPTIYVMDAEGKIRFKNLNGEQLDKAITELLAEIDVKVDVSNHEDEEDKKSDSEEADGTTR